MTSKRKLWRPTDLIWPVILLIGAVCFVVLRPAGQTEDVVCDIILEGEVILTTGLDRDGLLTVEQRPQVEFEIKDRRIGFIRSDCPDKVCIHSGYLGEAGQTAACLPNRLVIRLRSEGGEGPDAVV